MRVDDFDFELPEDRIALRPASPRDSARLLVSCADGALLDRTVRDLPDLLAPGDVLVFNDTRVIPARLRGVRVRDGSQTPVEATLLRAAGPDAWTALMRPGRRLRPGDALRFTRPGDADAPGERPLEARVEAKEADGVVRILFTSSGADLMAALERTGVPPLPPYIAARRAEDDRDRDDYQTIYARSDGSVAAPTAGLHFTPELMAALDARGVERRFVTLHVGAGTFLPVKAETVEDHRMHAETGEVSAATAEALTAARQAGRRIVCVGTTSLRLLESAVDPSGGFHAFAGDTDIFIRPGRPVRSADALLTNFHLPRSTLLMLVAAFAGIDRQRAAYGRAVAGGYRFYSYGDASLWFRNAGP